MSEREQRAKRTKAAGMEPCEWCGLPAEPATWYCGRCWYHVERLRESLKELGIR